MCLKFHQNCPSFVGDITENILVSFLRTQCILYADDLFLLSPSVIGLQSMLDKCSEVVKYYHLSLMPKIHTVLPLGKRVLVI